MATLTGTATNFLDLFQQFRTFVFDGASGAGWLPAMSGEDYINYEGVRRVDTTYHSEEAAWRLLYLDEQYIALYEAHPATFQMLNSTTIGGITLTVPNVSGGDNIVDQSPETIALDSSSDGISWTEEHVWTGITKFGDFEKKTFALPSPVTSEYFRLREVNSHYSNYAYIMLVEFLDDTLALLPFNTRKRISAEFVAKCPFSASGVNAHIRVGLYYDDTTPYYTLQLNGGSLAQEFSLITGDKHFDIVNESPTTNAFFWDSSMPFWFYGSDRFVQAVVRVGGTYRQFGFGLHLAYATPDQYPMPMFVGAENSDRDSSWEHDQGGNIRGFSNPGLGSLYIFTPDQAWNEFRNYVTSSGNDTASPLTHNLWPGHISQYRSLRNAPGTNDTNGNYFLFPTIAMKNDESVFGELPNVYVVPSLNLAPEDTITYGGDTYRVFPNIWRTSAWDFCAIKEE